MESMVAAGLSFVAAGAGGPAELLADGETRLLYPPRDVDALASLLRLLAEDSELRSRLGVLAPVVIYLPERVADQNVDAYRHLLVASAQAISAGVSNRGGPGRRRRSQRDGVADGA